MLSEIIENNSYPIVFIGSGMSKRYLRNFPTWSELLKEYWELLNEPNTIFHFMRNLEQIDEVRNANDNEREFLINVKTAAYIKKKYDDSFYNGNILLEGLTQEEAYRKKISPFNYSITQRFSQYEIKEEMSNEIEEYKKFLLKAKVIITTNYDTLTEDLLESMEQKPTIYVGQHGLFDETYNWSELFKIHGDVDNPNSIVITEEDYNRYDHNSVLISAKILANLINSPIIFLGYSLSDRNVQKLLSDFASQLPDDDIRKNSNRITVVEFSSGESDFVEQIINNPDLNISHAIIKTDNYLKLYQEICKIDQGLTPHEVSRFEGLIKDIVITAGKKGKLDSYLVSPQNLDNLPEDLRRRRLVVALGDKKNMFVNPSLIDYIEDYFIDGAAFLPEVSLRFIANENTQARIPFIKHVRNMDFENFDFLNTRQKKKIRARIDKMGNISEIINTVPKSNKREYDNLEDILKLQAPTTRELELIAYNIRNFTHGEVFEYINNYILPVLADNYNNSAPELSAQRRLLLAYDLLVNGDIT